MTSRKITFHDGSDLSLRGEKVKFDIWGLISSTIQYSSSQDLNKNYSGSPGYPLETTLSNRLILLWFEEVRLSGELNWGDNDPCKLLSQKKGCVQTWKDREKEEEGLSVLPLFCQLEKVYVSPWLRFSTCKMAVMVTPRILSVFRCWFLHQAPITRCFWHCKK